MDEDDPSGSSGPAAASPPGLRIVQALLLALAGLALVGCLVALLLVGRIETTYRDGLGVARGGADVAASSTRAAVSLAGDVAALADTAVVTLTEAQRLVELGAASADGLGLAFGTNVASSVEGTANIASGMAGFVEAIERLIPGDSQSLAEDLRALADGLGPVPEQLRTLGVQLQDAAAQLRTANGSLDTVATQLAAVSREIDDATIALGKVDALAAELELRAQAALDRSNTDFWLQRVLVLVLGLGVAIACLAAHRALRGLQLKSS